MRLRYFLLCVLWMAPSGRPVLSQTVSKEEYVPVAFCDLVERPAEYDGRRVSVYATYRYGFEWQEIYCMKCRGGDKTWPEFPPDSPQEMRRALRRAPKGQGTLNGTFKGAFQSQPGAFGDGGYRFQLVLESVTNVEVISRSSGAPEALTEAERKRLCHGEAAGR